MVDGDRLVVVGNGMVGWHFCQQAIARSLTKRFQIVVYGEEPRPAYDRIRLSACLNGTVADELTLGSRAWYAEHGIDLRTGTTVVAFDPNRNRIEASDGICNYAQLVLATGSRPLVPPIPGAEHDNVMTYRTVEDVQQIKARATPGTRVVIIGGGLLGLELAKALADNDVQVVILERSPGLMIRQLNVVASNILRSEIERLGIQVKVEVHVAAIDHRTGVVDVRLRDGDVHTAELVIIAAGIRPRDELARAAGLTCSPSGGIIVDRFLRTSSPHISAIGECVSFGSTVYGLAAPGYHMADILTRRLHGDMLAEFDGYDLGTRLKLAGLDVATFGDYQADGSTATWRHGSDYRQVVLREGRLVGATLIGGWSEQAALADAVTRKLTIDQRRLSAFSRDGSLFAGTTGVVAWPAAALVCSCMRVTRGVLGQALVDGCDSVAALQTTTRAGTVCGSCRPLLADLVGADPADQPVPRGGKVLGVASLVSVFVVILAMLWQMPRAQSYAELGFFEFAWRDGTAKQITGWTMAGLVAVSCLYVVRKRLLSLRWGDLGLWRAIHAILATSAALLLVAHTGFRWGHQLDQWLAIMFATVLVIGGMAGLFVASERHRDGPTVRRLRVWSLRLHLGAVSLLVPLVIAHVIKVYAW